MRSRSSPDCSDCLMRGARGTRHQNNMQTIPRQRVATPSNVLRALQWTLTIRQSEVCAFSVWRILAFRRLSHSQLATCCATHPCDRRKQSLATAIAMTKPDRTSTLQQRAESNTVKHTMPHPADKCLRASCTVCRCLASLSSMQSCEL